MPKKKRPDPLYRRGEYWLDWDRRRDGSLRSPFLGVFWFDSARGGNRSRSTSTASLEEAKAWLDAFYLERTGGQAICPTCKRPLERTGGYFVTEAIATYLTLHVTAGELASADAITTRLDHVLDYLEESGQLAVTCEQIDERWIERFRKWAARRPVISTKGREIRDRSLSTIEGSVAQLSAAINDAHRRGNASHAAAFKSQPIRGLNQTPKHRSGVEQLAAMFRYCVAPDVSDELGRRWGKRKEPYSEAELIKIRRRERASLHRFLIASVATLARPDAALDISLDPSRRQWTSEARILDLNPKGRRQTKKYRAIVPIAWQVAAHFDAKLDQWRKDKAEAEKAKTKPPAAPYFVGPKSVRKAWNRMAAELGLPGDREAGEKLIRRSMGDLVRHRMNEAHGPESVAELEMFLGHDKTDPVTDLYAPFSPHYLRRSLAAIEGIIDEIERKTPGAFAAANGKVAILRRKA